MIVGYLRLLVFTHLPPYSIPPPSLILIRPGGDDRGCYIIRVPGVASGGGGNGPSPSRSLSPSPAPGASASGTPSPASPSIASASPAPSGGGGVGVGGAAIVGVGAGAVLLLTAALGGVLCYRRRQRLVLQQGQGLEGGDGGGGRLLGWSSGSGGSVGKIVFLSRHIRYILMRPLV